MSIHAQTRKKHGSQKGFTLIEIAIVLVIIGLLLGGVLKGQELINTARVRALNNSVDGITAAWFSFQDRYRAFPGDYSKADVNIQGIDAADVGDGNGIVGKAGAADDPDERGLVWLHLEAAGYITGGYDGASVATTEFYSCTTDTCPDNGFGSGMVLNHGQENRSATSDTHELITGQGIPVDVLAELDRKVDDGSADAGLMQISDDAAYDACVATPDYELQTPVDNCAAVFRNF